VTRFRVEDGGPLAIASISSVALHATLFLLGFLLALRTVPTDFFGSGGALPIDVVDAPAPLAEEPMAAAPPKPAPPPRAEPQPRTQTPPKRVAPVVKIPPTMIDGVRIASAEDVRRRLERGEQPKRVVPPPQPAAVPQAPPSTGTNIEPKVETAAIGKPALGGSPDGLVKTTEITEPEDDDDKAYSGMFRADTPGYNGRIFGQVSVRSSVAPESVYGRIHLFRESSVYRDYSAKSLFGYSFQQSLGDVATRGFETGRVTTPGAYLMVTDLFGDGHYSTMSHTVIFAFPRRPPAGGGNLYDVVEEPGGDFRLRGPGGSALVFDGKHGGLRALAGFVVAPPGDIGTPPRVSYRGLHLRLEAVGSNPFLRDRPATVVDASGNECSLSTSDLFNYAGRRESDVFRFADDADFFAFLRSRCDGLSLPKPAPTLVAKAAPKAPPEKKVEKRAGSQGLVPYLLRGFR